MNGKGQGGKLSEIFNINKLLSKLEPTDFFLDNVSGDLYVYNRESEEWHPKGNVGLHHRRSAEEYQTLGKYIVKAPIYRPKKMNELVEIYKAKTTETIIYIKKNYLNHWAIKNIYPYEFKAQLLGEWDCHAFSFVNKEKMFIVLAESERGPALLDFGNILASHFNVEKNYASTMPMVKNFIDRSIDILKTNQMNSIKKILECQPKSTVINIISFNEKNSKKTRVREAIKNDKFDEDIFKIAQHVGFSFSKNKFPQIIENNAVTYNLDSVPKIIKKTVKVKRPSMIFDSPSKLLKTQSSMKNISLMRNNSLITKNSITEGNCEKDETFLSKKQIRNFLHPALSNDHIKDEPMWVYKLYLYLLVFYI